MTLPIPPQEPSRPPEPPVTPDPGDEAPVTPPTEPDPIPVQEPPDAPGNQQGPYVVA